MAGKDYRLGWMEPAYRYGFESAHRYEGRNWNDIESQLSTDWTTYEHRTKSTWEEIKGAVRDAWELLPPTSFLLPPSSYLLPPTSYLLVHHVAGYCVSRGPAVAAFSWRIAPR